MLHTQLTDDRWTLFLGEEALLWMTNKWMVCHPDSPQAAKGAHVGIRGENLQLRL